MNLRRQGPRPPAKTTTSFLKGVRRVSTAPAGQGNLTQQTVSSYKLKWEKLRTFLENRFPKEKYPALEFKECKVRCCARAKSTSCVYNGSWHRSTAIDTYSWRPRPWLRWVLSVHLDMSFMLTRREEDHVEINRLCDKNPHAQQEREQSVEPWTSVSTLYQSDGARSTFWMDCVRGAIWSHDQDGMQRQSGISGIGAQVGWYDVFWEACRVALLRRSSIKKLVTQCVGAASCLIAEIPCCFIYRGCRPGRRQRSALIEDRYDGNCAWVYSSPGIVL